MRGAIILVVLAVAACRQEPSFDERYESAQQSIAQKAEELDAEFREGASADEPAAQATR